MNETTFENAKVGDRVWDLRHGWGTVNSRQDNAPCPLSVWFDTGTCLGFSFDGHSYSQNGSLRTLFWHEIKLEAPPRPKRKIKKVVEGWVNICTRAKTGEDTPLHMPLHMGRHIYQSSSEASRQRCSIDDLGGGRRLGEPLFIHYEYEVEE